MAHTSTPTYVTNRPRRLVLWFFSPATQPVNNSKDWNGRENPRALPLRGVVEAFRAAGLRRLKKAGAQGPARAQAKNSGLNFDIRQAKHGPVQFFTNQSRQKTSLSLATRLP